MPGRRVRIGDPLLVGLEWTQVNDGASAFIVLGKLDEPTVKRLVEALGAQTINVIGVPG